MNMVPLSQLFPESVAGALKPRRLHSLATAVHIESVWIRHSSKSYIGNEATIEALLASIVERYEYCRINIKLTTGK
jgi:predicted thioesterase